MLYGQKQRCSVLGCPSRNSYNINAGIDPEVKWAKEDSRFLCRGHLRGYSWRYEVRIFEINNIKYWVEGGGRTIRESAYSVAKHTGIKLTQLYYYDERKDFDHRRFNKEYDYNKCVYHC